MPTPPPAPRGAEGHGPGSRLFWVSLCKAFFTMVPPELFPDPQRVPETADGTEARMSCFLPRLSLYFQNLPPTSSFSPAPLFSQSWPAALPFDLEGNVTFRLPHKALVVQAAAGEGRMPWLTAGSHWVSSPRTGSPPSLQLEIQGEKRGPRGGRDGRREEAPFELLKFGGFFHICAFGSGEGSVGRGSVTQRARLATGPTRTVARGRWG